MRVHSTPHARNLPLPVISLRPSSKTIRRAACGVTSSVFATIFADTNGFAITKSTSSGNFEGVRRPSSFRSNSVRASASLSCSLSPVSAAAISPWAMASNRVSRSRCRRRSTGMVFRPRLMAAGYAPVVMPAWRKIDAANKRPSHGACCRTDSSVPGIEGNDRLQHRRQLVGPAQHATPFVEPRILVPVEIIDESISLAGVESRPHQVNHADFLEIVSH